MTPAATSKDANRIRTFRWVFYISLFQFVSFYLGPAFLFPAEYLFHIEMIVALTFGLVPVLYFLIVNLAGIFLDRSRRPLHVTLTTFLALWFLWAGISWAEIEQMDYLLR